MVVSDQPVDPRITLLGAVIRCKGCSRERRRCGVARTAVSISERGRAVLVLNFIHIVVNILLMTLIARAVLSWVNPPWHKAPFNLLIEVTEPILAPLRSVIPRVGMFDISYIVAILVLQFVSQVV